MMSNGLFQSRPYYCVQLQGTGPETQSLYKDSEQKLENQLAK